MESLKFRKRLINLKGKRFGRLTAVKYDLIKLKWDCICDCGNFATVGGQNLRIGRTKSCGCLRKEIKRNAMIKYQKTIKESKEC